MVNRNREPIQMTDLGPRPVQGIESCIMGIGITQVAVYARIIQQNFLLRSRFDSKTGY